MPYKKILIFLYKKISKVYVIIFGRKIMQPVNNLVLSLSLKGNGYMNYGSFKDSGEKFFINLIRDELKLSLDIGANVGNYTEMLLSDTNSKVISFEPLPKAFDKLKLIKSDYKDRLEIHNVAIGIKDEVLELFYGTEKSEKASLMKDLEKISFIKEQNKNKVSVQVRQLDYFQNYFKDEVIDFIKIDTEGFEYEVLMGAKNILEIHQPKFIQVEFNWHQLIKKQTLYNFSELIKFSDVFKILPYGNKLLHIDPFRPENNIYHLSNYVFIRKDISDKYK
ncbi:FkbM family methyltransferase [Candidatus Pelagibacter sp.]|nr:FkbM family methyltransferase [Candidatus Pelagibacter sp.]